MFRIRYSLLFCLIILLAFFVTSCNGITIQFGQSSEEISNNSDPTETLQPESTETPQPEPTETPQPEPTETPQPETNDIQDVLPQLSILATELAEGTLDFTEIQDISVLLGNEWAEYAIHPAVLPVIPVNIFPTDITGIAIFNVVQGDLVNSWYDYGGRAMGSSQNLGEINSPGEDNCPNCYYILPPFKSPDDVIDIAMPHFNFTFYYFTDGTVSVGNPVDADSEKAPEPFTLPPGKYTGDIVGIASTCDNRYPYSQAVVYAWYKDGTVSSGTYLDLDAYRAPYEYTIPPGKTIELINSIGIACSDDHVYVWYWDGTVSSGMSDNLGMFRDPMPYTTP